MYVGKSLGELAAEIERQAKSKRDFVASTQKMEIVPMGGTDLAVRLGNQGDFPINDIAFDQITEHVKIPRVYADRMRKEAPDLYATNVQRWFEKYPAVRMLRTLDHRGRAFLSDKFNTLDNYDFANAALPILAERKLNIVSCEITEKRLYLKAVDEKLYRDIPVGYRMGDGSHKIYDTCAPALILSNSEVGFGRLVVETGTYTSACTNLCWFAKDGFKRTHVGARHKLTEGLDVADLDEVMSSATKQRTMEALWMQVRDVIASAFDEKVIRARAEKLEVAAGRKIERKVEEVIEVVANRFSLTEDEQGSVLQHLIQGGSLSQYGLHAALTRSAQDAKHYDRATELEYAGGNIIELAPADWKVLAEAA